VGAYQGETLNAESYCAQGETCHRQRDFDQAIACYTEALRLDPQRAEAYVGRGVSRRAKGDVDGAIADHSEAIRLNPRSVSAYVNRGIARRSKGDMDGAIVDYNEAIRLNPQDAVAYNNRGYTRYEKGDNAGAIADCNEAIRLNGRQAYFYHSRALPRAAMGDYAGAIADFQQTLQLMPNHPKAQFMRDKIAEWSQLAPKVTQSRIAASQNAPNAATAQGGGSQSVIRPIVPPPTFTLSPLAGSPQPGQADRSAGSDADIDRAFQALLARDQTSAARPRENDSNLVLGIVGGVVGAIAGAVVWGIFAAVTGIELGLIAIAIGFLVGYGVRFFGKGEDIRYGVIGAILAMIGCFAGNVLAILIIVGREDVSLARDLLAHPAVIGQIMGRSFSPIDALFYIIAVYEGYRFSWGTGSSNPVRQRAIKR
jgi:tetratricopeptide (TPR) repeat protein